ncbi:hypothetical protein K8I31_08275 [bacterium]|nr:hypothetical protein [bacterium]
MKVKRIHIVEVVVAVIVFIVLCVAMTPAFLRMQIRSNIAQIHTDLAEISQAMDAFNINEEKIAERVRMDEFNENQLHGYEVVNEKPDWVKWTYGDGRFLKECMIDPGEFEPYFNRKVHPPNHFNLEKNWQEFTEYVILLTIEPFRYVQTPKGYTHGYVGFVKYPYTGQQGKHFGEIEYSPTNGIESFGYVMYRRADSSIQSVTDILEKA